jgi:hypothetical protein
MEGLVKTTENLFGQSVTERVALEPPPLLPNRSSCVNHYTVTFSRDG